MQNSTYDPKSVQDFEKTKVQFNGQKASVVCPAGQSAHADLTLTDDHLLTGCSIILKNNIPSDEVNFQIIHPTYGVVNQFADWYAKEFDKILPYPAKIPAGLTIRVLYISKGTQDVEIYVNFDLHKVLV
jgi:hypothetical protein